MVLLLVCTGFSNNRFLASIKRMLGWTCVGWISLWNTWKYEPVLFTNQNFITCLSATTTHFLSCNFRWIYFKSFFPDKGGNSKKKKKSEALIKTKFRWKGSLPRIGNSSNSRELDSRLTLVCEMEWNWFCNNRLDFSKITRNLVGQNGTQKRL